LGYALIGRSDWILAHHGGTLFIEPLVRVAFVTVATKKTLQNALFFRSEPVHWAVPILGCRVAA